MIFFLTKNDFVDIIRRKVICQKNISDFVLAMSTLLNVI